MFINEVCDLNGSFRSMQVHRALSAGLTREGKNDSSLKFYLYFSPYLLFIMQCLFDFSEEETRTMSPVMAAFRSSLVQCSGIVSRERTNIDGA